MQEILAGCRTFSSTGCTYSTMGLFIWCVLEDKKLASVALKVECFTPDEILTSPHSPDKTSRERKGVFGPGPWLCSAAPLEIHSGAASLLKKHHHEAWERAEGRRGASAHTFLSCATVQGPQVLGKFSFNCHFPGHLCARRGLLGRMLYLSFHAQMNWWGIFARMWCGQVQRIRKKPWFYFSLETLRQIQMLKWSHRLLLQSN